MGSPSAPAAVDLGALRAQVVAARAAPLTPGDTWHVVATSWLNRLTTTDPDPDPESDPAQAQAQASAPGPIDSSDLAAASSAVFVPASLTPLRTDIVAEQDYELLPATTWDSLAAAFGTTGATFPRLVIPGMSAEAERVELWPPSVHVVRISSTHMAINSLPQATFNVSVAAPISGFKRLVRSSLQLDSGSDADLRFWRLAVDQATADTTVPAPIDPTQLPTLQPELVDEQLAASTGSSDPTLEMLQIDGRQVTLAVDVRANGKWTYDNSPAAAEPITTTTTPTTTTTTTRPSTVKGVFATNKEDHWSAVQSQAHSVAPLTTSTNGTTANGWSTTVQAPATPKPEPKKGPKGLVGLQNLGNTCFMNSALQCLSNTPEVQEYFVSNVFHDEINRDNPLGNGGALAEAFGALLQRIWTSKAAAGGNKGALGRFGGGWSSAISPREFKFAVSRFAPQFAGYGQQDTQELLAFLLDGLHEDLNRIQKKPYIEAPDWEGGDDRALVEFARKQWDIYKARNDSLIVDLFQGQYKSTLVCPDCHKVAIKFDPFMYLTLPIPNRRQWTGSIFFVPYDPSQPTTKITLSVPQDSTMAQLRTKVSEATGVPKEHLVSGEVWQRNIQKWYLDWDAVTDIGSADVAYFWELPVAVRMPPTKHSAFKFVRSGAQAATEYERIAGPKALPDADDWAILPVFTMLALVGINNNSRTFRRGTKASALPMGVPFFAAIPPEQKNDPEAVARVVEWQYTRYAQSAEQLREIIHPPTPEPAATASESTTASGPSAMDTSEDAPSTPAAPTMGQEDDTESVTMDEIESSPEPELRGAHEAPPTSLNTEPAPTSEAPPSAFKMYYIARRFTSPLPQSGAIFDDGGEILADRVKRLCKGSEWETVDYKEGEQEETTQESWPLVYTSGGIVCVWTTIAAKTALIRGEQEVWGPYQEKVDESFATAKGRAGRKTDLSLWNCLDEFTRSEQLGADDLWYCPNCKDFRQATKKFDLWKVPDILVVHLKRFSAARYSRDKIDDYVDFPITGLDLSDYVQGPKVINRLEKEGNNPLSSVTSTAAPPSESFMTPPPSDVEAGTSDRTESRPVNPDSNDDAVASDYPIYDLYAVDNHYGGLGGGHYTASARNPEDGQWYYYDDSSVRPIKPEDAKTRAAYLLFYRRRTTRPIGGKTRQRLDESLSSLPASTDALPQTNQPGALVHGSSNLAVPLGPDGLPEADAANDPYASSSSDDSSLGGDILGRKLGRGSFNVRHNSNSSQSDPDEQMPWLPRRTRVGALPVQSDDEFEGDVTHVAKTEPGQPKPQETNIEEAMKVDSARDQLFSTPSSFYQP